jgi:hypothetical protein
VSAAHHRLAAPASVGVQEMDDEHAACTKVILQVYFTAYLCSKYWQYGLELTRSYSTGDWQYGLELTRSYSTADSRCA